MKKINSYLEEKYINEGFFDWLKKLWNFLTDKDDIYDYKYGKNSALKIDYDESKKIKLDTSKISFLEVKDSEMFNDIIKKSKPNESNNEGLYYFDKLKSRKEYKKLETKPWNTKAMIISDKETKSGDATNIYGLFTYVKNCPIYKKDDSIILLDCELLNTFDISYHDVLKKILNFLISDVAKVDKNITKIKVAINNNELSGIEEDDIKWYEKLGFVVVEEGKYKFLDKNLKK